jgi:NAD(P)H-nitrite reductase large subunit
MDASPVWLVGTKGDLHGVEALIKYQKRTMPNYKYLIGGGGMTADAAVYGIREVDRDGSIGLLSAEGHPASNRPPLSKKLWKGKPLESIWRRTECQGVTLHLGRTARHLDSQNKRITDDQGTAYGYGKLLLATGGTPRRLAFGGEQIIYYHTLDDYERLRALTSLKLCRTTFLVSLGFGIGRWINQRRKRCGI